MARIDLSSVLSDDSAIIDAETQRARDEATFQAWLSDGARLSAIEASWDDEEEDDDIGALLADILGADTSYLDAY